MSEVEKIEKPWGYVLMLEGEAIGRVIKDRRLFVIDDDTSLEPDTLVGSAFLTFVEGECIWQGVVVGEPQPGRYLCHIERLDQEVGKVQRIFTLDTLTGLGEEARRVIEGAVEHLTAPIVHQHIEWRLYDNEDAAKEAYIAWAAKLHREDLEGVMRDGTEEAP